METDAQTLLKHVASIVTSYVESHTLPADQLPALIAEVYQSLLRLGEHREEEVEATQEPAVNPKRSVFPDYIVCLEDGKRFKAIKRHLSAQHSMTPKEYRQKWGLPATYPMTAPNYAAMRSEHARATGLGSKRVGSRKARRKHQH